MDTKIDRNVENQEIDSKQETNNTDCLNSKEEKTSQPETHTSDDAKEIEEQVKNKVAAFADSVENFNRKDIPSVKNGQPNDNSEFNKTDKENTLYQLTLTTLFPQLQINEEQKRDFKQHLMKYVKKILMSQLAIVGAAFVSVMIAMFLNVSSPVFVNNFEAILDFLKYYITAIIVEFITILFFIVKYVFDKSVVQLLSDAIKSIKGDIEEKDKNEDNPQDKT